MKKISFIFILFAFSISCSTVPVTGRRQLDLVPDGQMLALSNSSYREFLSQNKKSTNAQQTQMVVSVGKDIQRAVEKYFQEKNLTKDLKDYSWEFNLVEDPAVNAWCMPGGKVVIYTGILPITQDATGLAVVMGHEIAHAVAKHGNERMSQQLTAQLGGVALQVALKDKPQQTQSIFYTAYGVGSQVGVLLPFSRLQESESDELGLIFMAMAGYNPSAAVPFWERMAAQGGQTPPEFLSTHPAPNTRIEDIKKNLPTAMKYYNNSVKK